LLLSSPLSVSLAATPCGTAKPSFLWLAPLHLACLHLLRPPSPARPLTHAPQMRSTPVAYLFRVPLLTCCRSPLIPSIFSGLIDSGAGMSFVLTSAFPDSLHLRVFLSRFILDAWRHPVSPTWTPTARHAFLAIQTRKPCVMDSLIVVSSTCSISGCSSFGLGLTRQNGRVVILVSITNPCPSLSDTVFILEYQAERFQGLAAVSLCHGVN